MKKMEPNSEEKFNHDSLELYNMQDKLLEYCIKRKEEESGFSLPKSLVKYIIEEVRIIETIRDPSSGKYTCKYCDYAGDNDENNFHTLHTSYKCSKSKAITGEEYIEYIEDLKNEKKNLENKIEDLEKYKSRHESKYYQS